MFADTRTIFLWSVCETLHAETPGRLEYGCPSGHWPNAKLGQAELDVTWSVAELGFYPSQRKRLGRAADRLGQQWARAAKVYPALARGDLVAP